MIKVMEIVRRRPGMDVEAFQAYWLDVHGPIVSRLPGLRRYVQSHPRQGGYRRGDMPFDGIAELWFDDSDALRALQGGAELAAVREDERVFIAADGHRQVFVDEHLIKDGPVTPGALKNVEFLHLSTDLGPEEGHRYWLEHHGPLAACIPTLSRYVQSHVRPGAYGRATPPRFDGVALTWWADLDAMRASAESPQYAATRADEPNFIAGTPPVILTNEHVLVDTSA